ncbi:hypothetical protein C8R45DRAFT_480095 [Mycena sanguinolenta]|nr:hypothetical protein C8R45DRAFT_480095 [Mycena sanguinolenta]
MPSRVPQELLDEILDNLAGDSRSLNACSLASSTMVARSRSHLFNMCHLSQRVLLAFRDLLRSPNCTFIPHVHRIRAYRYSGGPEDHLFNEVAEDLRRLTNVRVLQVILNVVLDASNVDDYLLRGFFAAFPHTMRLVLHCGFGTTSFPVPLMKTLCMFPALEELHLHDSSSWTVEDAPAGAIPPSKLRSVVLTMDTNGPILAWMHATGHLQKLNSVHLALVKLPHGPTVRVALQQLGKALRSLDIEVTFTPGDYWAPSANVFDLALHPHLETLVIRDHSDTRTFDPNQMTRLITRLAAPSLERISLSLSSRQYQPRMQWNPLDAFLCSPQFPRLRTVALKCNRGYDGDKLFRRMLPLLQASGVVETKW